MDASARITAPDPVPSSNIRFCVRCCLDIESSGNSFNAASTRNSVSGLGIRTSFVTAKSMDQNSLNPTMYATGSLFNPPFYQLLKL